MLGMLSFDYRRLERHAYLVYLVVLLARARRPARRTGGRRVAALDPSRPDVGAAVRVHEARARPGLRAPFLADAARRSWGCARRSCRWSSPPCPPSPSWCSPISARPRCSVLLALTMLVLGGVQLRWLALLALARRARGAAPVAPPEGVPAERILTFLDPEQIRSVRATTSSSRRSPSARGCCGARASCREPRTI